MSNRFYKTRKNRLVAGVVAGLADKFGWDLALARILASKSLKSFNAVLKTKKTYDWP